MSGAQSGQHRRVAGRKRCARATTGRGAPVRHPAGIGLPAVAVDIRILLPVVMVGAETQGGSVNTADTGRRIAKRLFVSYLADGTPAGRGRQTRNPPGEGN